MNKKGINKKKTKEEVSNKLKNIWPDIEIISEYINAGTKCTFQCKKCGHEWVTTVNAVLHSKRGCPRCGVREAFAKKSKDDLLKRLPKQFTLIDFIARDNIIVKCNNCGSIRHTNKSNLLRYGCKTCSTKLVIDSQRKTTEQFISEAKQIHGDKYDYSKVNYHNGKQKVEIICPKHGSFM